MASRTIFGARTPAGASHPLAAHACVWGRTTRVERSAVAMSDGVLQHAGHAAIRHRELVGGARPSRRPLFRLVSVARLGGCFRKRVRWRCSVNLLLSVFRRRTLPLGARRMSRSVRLPADARLPEGAGKSAARLWRDGYLARRRVRQPVAPRERGLELDALLRRDVALVEPELGERADEEEDAVVVAANREPVERVVADVLAGGFAEPVDKHLGAPLVEDRRVNVPIARAASASS
mmetsp:Transcript_49360/g.106911  ORF Transcript_49360/g.106911 Transcript_49360/m.106911 type:complete len:235 (+) Transcript_49360:921-1625(+)